MIISVTLNASVDKLYFVGSLKPFEVMRVGEVCNTAGGKGMNVARAASITGERVAAMGFVGGHNGELFESLINEENIEKHFTRVKSETRCCVNVRDRQTNRSTEFLEPGQPVAEDETEAFLRAYAALLPSADIVTISGSMPKGVPPDFYGTMIKKAKEQGKPVILDSSGEALRLAIPCGPALIKPNKDEICQLMGRKPASLNELAGASDALRRMGAGAVAVSLGRDGVLVNCAEGVFRGITPDIPVVNTVGCGDSMVAGFAVSMARHKVAEEAIRFAVAVSTANALTAKTGFFRKEDLNNLLNMVKVERLTGGTV